MYLIQKVRGSQNFSILLLNDFLYYTSLHVRFSSIFYSTQLVDLFSYELPLQKKNNTNYLKNNNSYSDSYLVYNFHNVNFQDRFFLFSIDTLNINNNNNSINSISELFPNANWLEREVSELNGIIFSNKKDLRNLLLQYGDTSVPFQKSAPSIGYKEFYYDSVNDILLETPITIQI